MQTSRFQLGLIAALAGGLGYSMSSSEAVGYPAGAAVSKASNPVWAFGGGISTDSSSIVLTAPTDQDMVVNDVILGPSTADMNCDLVMRARLTLETGAEVARFTMIYDSYAANVNQSNIIDRIDAHYISGIRVPAGDSLIIEATTLAEGWGCSGESLEFSLAGYYAQP